MPSLLTFVLVFISPFVLGPHVSAIEKNYLGPEQAPNPAAIRDETLDLNGPWRFGFGGVDYACEIFVNEHLAGRFAMHFENSESPIFYREFDVTTDQPNVYDTELILLDSNGQTIDRVRSYVTFVTFTQRNGYLTENGKPFQVRGHLNQHIYPDTLYTPTREKILREIE